MKETPLQGLEAVARALNEVASAIAKIYPNAKPTELDASFNEAAIKLLRLLNVE